MNKIAIVIAVVVVVAGGVWYGSSIKNESPKNTSEQTVQSLASPDRLAEVNGYVLRMEGNELQVANEIGVKEVTAEERARRQKLTQEERQALKAQESANLTKENITITIPVGSLIVKGSGDASGTNVKAQMSEIVKGVYVSIWKSGESVELVKLKGVSTQ